MVKCFSQEASCQRRQQRWLTLLANNNVSQRFQALTSCGKVIGQGTPVHAALAPYLATVLYKPQPSVLFSFCIRCHSQACLARAAQPTTPQLQLHRTLSRVCLSMFCMTSAYGRWHVYSSYMQIPKLYTSHARVACSGKQTKVLMRCTALLRKHAYLPYLDGGATIVDLLLRANCHKSVFHAVILCVQSQHPVPQAHPHHPC